MYMYAYFDRPLCMSFVSPWGDASSRVAQLIPSCYKSVGHPNGSGTSTVPPLLSRIGYFSEETLFFMFFSGYGSNLVRTGNNLPTNRTTSPPLPSSHSHAAFNSSIQKLVAQELSNRRWKFHLDLKLWMLPDESTFILFDPVKWEKTTTNRQEIMNLDESVFAVIPSSVNAPSLHDATVTAQ